MKQLQNESGLHFYQYGEGKLQIVFLHGLFGSGRNWYSFLRFVAEKYSVVAMAPDLRGHGKSEHFSDKKANLASIAEEVCRFLREQTDSPVALIGHSMGGKIAILAADQYPQQVSKLMIVDTGLQPLKEDVFVPVNWMKEMPVPMPDRREARDYFDQLVEDRRLRDFLLTNLQRYEDGYRWRIDLPAMEQLVADMVQRDLHRAWHNIRCPIQLIRGEDSEHLSEMEARQMVEAKAEIVYTSIANAGHWCHADQPTEFQHALDTFIAI